MLVCDPACIELDHAPLSLVWRAAPRSPPLAGLAKGAGSARITRRGAWLTCSAAAALTKQARTVGAVVAEDDDLASLCMILAVTNPSPRLPKEGCVVQPSAPVQCITLCQI